MIIIKSKEIYYIEGDCHIESNPRKLYKILFRRKRILKKLKSGDLKIEFMGDKI